MSIIIIITPPPPPRGRIANPAPEDKVDFQSLHKILKEAEDKNYLVTVLEGADEGPDSSR